jgi:malonyl CoA-acyl carrier protein transacylase
MPAFKIFAGVIKTYLETGKTQLEIRNGNKKIAISGPPSSVAKILEQLQELGGSQGE